MRTVVMYAPSVTTIEYCLQKIEEANYYEENFSADSEAQHPLQTPQM